MWPVWLHEGEAHLGGLRSLFQVGHCVAFEDVVSLQALVIQAGRDSQLSERLGECT